jgi:O-antigen/teichoic acid export membrane protein
MSNRSLRRNFGWALAGNGGYALTQWGMLVALAKFGSATRVGEFAFALALTAPIVLFANLQLRAVQATDAGSAYTFADYLGLRTITTALALGAIALVAFIGGRGAHLALIIAVVGCAKAVESLSDVFHGFFQRYERMDRVALSLLVKGIASLGAWCLGLWLTGTVLGAALGLLIAWTATLLFVDQRSARRLAPTERFRPGYDRTKLQALASTVWPLGASMCLLSITTNIPRYFIEAAHGTATLGVFAGMAYLLTAGAMLMNALGQSTSPRVARLLVNGQHTDAARLLRRQLAIAGMLGVAGIVVAALFGRPLLALFYTAEFATETGAFVWIMVAACVGYLNSVFGYSLTAAREMRVQLPIELATALTTLVASALLVPAYGVTGAAWALLTGALARLLMQSVVLRSVWTNRFADNVSRPGPAAVARAA